jgi:2-polyprenyl-6-methoxyphenol hydroxylase-like FAD-dependent oxidoreductase
MPLWLNAIGYPAPEEERIDLRIGFASQMYRRTSPLPDGAFAVVADTEPRSHRAGAYMAIEDDRWLVTLVGCHGDYPPIDPVGFRTFAYDVAPVSELVEFGEPVGTFASYRLPATVRRHYERVHRFPQGLLVLGDALCTLNPLYGQGMTMAALQAVALQACLEDGTYGLAQRFFSSIAPSVDAAWQLGVDGWFRRSVLFAAQFDASVATRYLEVMSLARPFSDLATLEMLGRILLAHLGEAKIGPAAPELAVPFEV